MSHHSEYVSEVGRYFADNQSSEHSYRTAFQNYLATIFPATDGYFIQQDAKAVDGNKPDYIILKHQVPLLYIEVKKVGEDLDKIEKSQQADRYFGYTNLIISDYIEFRFFRNGQRYDEPIVLADIHKPSHTITPHADRGEHLARTITDFVSEQREPITRASHLAKIMGGKAQRIRDNVIALLHSDSDRKADLEKMQRFIKDHLIAEFTTEDFADMYAQTLVYGLFAARYNDTSLDTFSRQEARTLIPATNPFLQSFFDHISGPTFPRRLEIIVDELCTVFAHADVRTLMEEYFKQMALDGGAAEAPDPVIHFYEDFLREYNPKKKMEMGVFYTPLPVVRFIVRGLDDLLKREFGIHDGLADTATIDKVFTHINDRGKEVKETRTLHRVQVLDVAVGTGTFLNETIRFIHDVKKSQQGRWGAYVNDHLLPRLHGFELMMASYTIAHLKLAMTLGQTGVQNFDKRIGVYLSNTLDTPHEQKLQGDLFGVVDSIARESMLASEVKTDRPIMVVLGNPPYSGISQNKHYTDNDVYKVEPGGGRLQERKHWLDDDYVKFIRFAESMIEKNGEGVIGMITAHGYLDNPTFRGMRWHLRQTFDAIYVLDLHGNSNKKETAPDGTEDKNVFDIKTGVSIIFGVKKKTVAKADALATVYRADLYGKRDAKFAALDAATTLETLEWTKLPAETEAWQQTGAGKAEYKRGFSVAQMFPKNTTGIVTMGDSFIVDQNRDTLQKRVETFLNSDMTEPELKEKYGLGKNYAKWVVDNKKSIDADPNNIVPLAYRPFDIRYTYFDNKLVWRPRTAIMKNFINTNNYGLVANRRIEGPRTFTDAYITSNIMDARRVSIKETNFVFPLYLYTDSGERVANLDGEIVNAIEGVVGTTTPEDILDYVYAVLHSPSYRAKYQEFLKSDFPRVPYPGEESGVSKKVFWELVAHGRHLRELHLLTHPAVRQPITTFPESGSDVVEKPIFKNGRVHINETQYWDGVPKEVWEFYIGGYQPAQKYLKDRKGRQLTSDEFENYERMIVSLNETIKVMGEIDKTWRIK